MKKFFVLIALFIFVAFAGCSASQDETLLGLWRWDDRGDFTYVFNADGTGTRGFSDETETFRWAASGVNLNLNRDARDEYRRDERWTFVIDGDVLTISSRQEQGMVYSYIFDSQQQDDALVGTWRWDEYGGYTYIFNANGTGTHGTSEEPEDITWSTTGTRLVINFMDDGYLYSDRWTYSITNGVLTIKNQHYDTELNYIYDSLQQDTALVGEWLWDDELTDRQFVYIFNANGTGNRGFIDRGDEVDAEYDAEYEDFTWTTTDNHLVIHAPEAVIFPLHWERWVYTISGSQLTLDNFEVEDTLYRYTKIS
jgi:hypothetical protein